VAVTETRLSVIIPSIGRETLADAVASCAGADEVVIVMDGQAPLPAIPPTAAVIFDRVSGGDHGYTARTRAMALATGTHLCFLDDDDEFTPGAIDLFRAAATNRPVIFRMEHPDYGVLWREPELRFSNVGTPMFLVPNDPDRLGVWAPFADGLAEPGGDFTFISGCAKKMGGVIWREEVVAVVQPRRLTVAVVTPWLNHPEFFDDYARALSVVTPRDSVIVVDDASDEPLSWAAIRMEERSGFAASCNAGLSHAQDDVVLFLNNDIVAERPDWLARLLAAVEPGVLVGAKMRRDPHGAVDGHQLPYLDGWCLGGMRADLLNLGGFDAEYVEPAYYSDNDLCFRARYAGMTLRQVRIGLRHLVGGTTGGPEEPVKVRATELNYERFAARVRAAFQEEVSVA
jgi:glycosyltransferase involved in cell wall biosynthesis